MRDKVISICIIFLMSILLPACQMQKEQGESEKPTISKEEAVVIEENTTEADVEETTEESSVNETNNKEQEAAQTELNKLVSSLLDDGTWEEKKFQVGETTLEELLGIYPDLCEGTHWQNEFGTGYKFGSFVAGVPPLEGIEKYDPAFNINSLIIYIQDFPEYPRDIETVRKELQSLDKWKTFDGEDEDLPYGLIYHKGDYQVNLVFDYFGPNYDTLMLSSIDVFYGGDSKKY